MQNIKLLNNLFFVIVFTLISYFFSYNFSLAGEYLNLYNKGQYNSAFRASYKESLNGSSDEADYVIGLILLSMHF